MSGVLTGLEATPGSGASFLGDDDPMTGAIRAHHMSGPGKLGLPELLEKKRLKYCIPDEAFLYQPVFDQVLVQQIPRRDQEKGNGAGKIPGTRLYSTKNTESRMMQEHPRGIIISAGAAALESFLSNGVDIGHTVILMRLSPWRLPVGTVYGYGAEMYVMVLHAGNIIASEDLREKMKLREVAYVVDKETCQVVYKDETGHKWLPIKKENDPEY
jgi:hypothetical protein